MPAHLRGFLPRKVTGVLKPESSGFAPQAGRDPQRVYLFVSGDSQVPVPKLTSRPVFNRFRDPYNVSCMGEPHHPETGAG